MRQIVLVSDLQTAAHGQHDFDAGVQFVLHPTISNTKLGLAVV